MGRIDEELRQFSATRRSETETAMQTAALQIVCGLDLAEVLAADTQRRRSELRRIDRLVQRERLKGLSRHWSYDLNRHIAMTQVSRRLRQTLLADGASP